MIGPLIRLGLTIALLAWIATGSSTAVVIVFVLLILQAEVSAWQHLQARREREQLAERLSNLAGVTVNLANATADSVERLEQSILRPAAGTPASYGRMH